MTPTKKAADDRRIAPVDLEAINSVELGPGARRWDGGEHSLGDHDMLPLEGENGDWRHVENHPGYEYRSLMCECGHVQIEGRDEQSPAPKPIIEPSAS